MSDEPNPPASWQEFVRALFGGAAFAFLWFIAVALAVSVLLLWGLLVGFHT